MKRILIIILLVAISLFLLLLQLLSYTPQTHPEEEAKEAVASGFDFIIDKDYTAAGIYIEDMAKAADTLQKSAELTDVQTDALLDALFGNFNYTIVSAESTDDPRRAVVRVNVVNGDMKSAVDSWKKDLEKIALKNMKKSEAEVSALMIDDLIKEIKEAPLREEEVIDISVIKTDDDTWKLNMTPEQFSILLGGLDQAL